MNRAEDNMSENINNNILKYRSEIKIKYYRDESEKNIIFYVFERLNINGVNRDHFYYLNNKKELVKILKSYIEELESKEVFLPKYQLERIEKMNK